MGPTWIALLVAAAVAAAVWQLRRRAAARRAECRRRFSTSLAESRPGLAVGDEGGGRWRLEEAGRPPVPVDGRALTRAASGAGARRIFLAVADAARQGPRALEGDFDLKRHGPRVLPRLAGEGLALLALEAPAARFAADGAAGLETVYVVDGVGDRDGRPACLTEEHLDGAGIDARDVHNVALAVLRQRFDEAPVRAALDGDGVTRVETTDGCGGSRLLLLPEALAAGETLFAAAPSPSALLIAGRRGPLERALAGLEEPIEPLPPALFRVDRGGLKREG